MLRAVLTPPSCRPAFVFAHPDDSVLSASAGLLASRGDALDVVVCGGRPPDGPPASWDAESGFRSSTEAHTTRMAEHDRACAALGVSATVLDIRDGQYDDRQEDERWVGAHDPGWQAAVDGLEAALCDFGAGLVVSHAPDAWHADHALAARLATVVAAQLGLRVVRVCDRPYMRCRPACQRQPAAQRTTVLTDGQWEAKHELVHCYRSQLGPLTVAFGRGWDARSVLGVECFAADTPGVLEQGGDVGPS